jgi:type I restriction enzyme S subunit
MAQELYELPQGWEWKTLEETTKIQSGTGFPKSAQGNENEEIPFLKVSDMNLLGNEHSIVSWNNSISLELASTIKAKVMPKGTIIFPKIGGAISTNKKRKLSTNSAYDNNVMGIKALKNLNTNYLFWVMQQIDLNDWASASALPSMKASTVKEHQIPVPPLAEQERIVAKLDALFSRIDQAIAQLQHTQAQTKTLWASALDQSFQKDKDRERIGDFCLVKGGKRLPKGKKLLEEQTDYPYIRVADFTDNGTIDLSGIKYITKEIHEQISRYIISAEDLYISIAGTIGKTGIIPKELNGANLTENAAKLVIKDRSKVELRYFYLFTQSSDFTTQAGLATKVVAQPKLALTRLSDIQAPLPPLAEQSKIVAQLDGISERTQALTAATSAQLEKFKALKASLLDAAFRGQLPSDQ